MEAGKDIKNIKENEVINSDKDITNKKKVKFIKIKENIHKVLCSINQKINCWDIKIRKDINQDKVYKNPDSYEDLTPTSDLDDGKRYCETINWALNNDKIHNVAITGIYGSGKSSILQSYQNQHCEHKYLNISLASFKFDNYGKSKDVMDRDNKKNIEEIEKGILEQIFYKVKYKDIPYSRFKKIKAINEKNISISLIWLGLIAFIVTFLFNKDSYELVISKVTKLIGPNVQNRFINILLLIFLGLSAIFIMVRIIKYFSCNYQIKKISLSNYEAEKKTIDNDSIFNKYIDEILYFFEVTKYDVVIFEDLDRFNDIDIFTELRHLNILINNSEQIGRKVVFIYAIKDDMFSNDYGKDDSESWKNRTKFFDFMIPVIPVINSKNACDMLIRKLKQANSIEGLEEDFIRDITFIVNDMRILKNIYNEYIVYLNNLKSKDVQIINYKLFSIIVYKNMYPTDFAKLQVDEGILYNIFTVDTHNKIINRKIDKYLKEIEIAKSRIRQIREEFLEDVGELRSLYIFDIINIEPIMNNILVNNQYVSFSDLAKKDELFEEFISKNNVTYQYQGYSGTYSSTISNIPEYLSKKNNYKKRKELIEERYNNGIKKLNNVITENSKNIEDIKALPFNKVIDSIDDINNVISNNTIYDKYDTRLLSYLVYKGYIDDTYYQYTSYFIEGSLTKRDQNFITKVLLEEKLDFNYKLDKVSEVIKNIKLSYFDKKYIMNFDLVDYLVEHCINDGGSRYEPYSRILNQLSNGDEDSIEFIFKYIARKKHLNIFLNDLCDVWKDFWLFIYYNDNFTNIEKDNYMKLIIQYAELNDITDMNENNIISNYISKMDNFLDIFVEEEFNSKVIEVLSNLSVSFEKIEEKKYKSDLLRFIYDENRYDINENMLRLMLLNYNGEDGIPKEFNTQNYTAITDSKCNSLFEYINEFLDIYIENVFLNLEENVCESEKVIIELLNSDELNIDSKETIIDKERTMLSSLDSVDKELWKHIILRRKVVVNWKNILIYYNEFREIDKVLSDYINSEDIYSILSENEVIYEDVIEKVVYDEFDKELLLSMDISDNCFGKIANKLLNSYNQIHLDGISKNRALQLIDSGKLTLNNENVRELKALGYDLHIRLICKEIYRFIEDFEEFDLESSDYNKLLNSNLSRNYLVDIINMIKTNYIEDDRDLAQTISNIILRGRKELDKDLVLILISNKIERVNKLKLFDRILENISEEDMVTCLENIGGEFAKIAICHRSARIEKNEINSSIINKLEKSKFKYISTIDRTNRNEIKINTKRNL